MRKGIPVVAIDGPAGAGKSTVAKKLAERLETLYLDTGAMYRALTLLALREGIDVNDGGALRGLLERSEIKLERTDRGLKVYLNGEDVTEEIRTPEVSSKVSLVARHPEVREKMVRIQRKMGERGAVAEGRDMGTVVFPDAVLKVFLTASLEERARRRQRDLEKMGIKKPLEEVMRELEERDRIDSSRDVAPLRMAKDAVLVDTTGLSVEEVVEKILSLLKRKGVDLGVFRRCGGG